MGLAEQMCKAARKAFRARRSRAPGPAQRQKSPARMLPAPAPVASSFPASDEAEKDGDAEPMAADDAETDILDPVAPKADPTGPDSISKYYADIARVPKHDSSDVQIAAVRAIRTAEHELWRALLGFPGTALDVAKAASGALEKPPAALIRTAMLVRDGGGKRALEAIGPAMLAPGLDIRRNALRAALAEAKRPSRAGAAAWRREVGGQARRLDAMKHDFLRKNLRYALAVARKHARPGMPFADAVQEANIGLLRALDGFDPDRGFKFTTYATWWIRQHISRDWDENSRTVRIPVHAQTTIRAVRRAAEALRQELGREPTTDELAAKCRMKPAAVVRLQVAQAPALPLDAPSTLQDGGEGRSLADQLPDEAPSPEALVLDGEARGSAVEAIEGLPANIARVMRLRFGLEGGEPMTLEDIGAEIGRTRERVRQLEARGLKALRAWLSEDGIVEGRHEEPDLGRADAPDLAGRRFGMLAVEGRWGRARWVCRCDCGGRRVAHGDLLLEGRVSSCGCVRGQRKEAEPPLRAGERYGPLTVVAPVEGPSGPDWAIWRVRCDCGEQRNMSLTAVRKGRPFGTCASAGAKARKQTVWLARYRERPAA